MGKLHPMLWPLVLYFFSLALITIIQPNFIHEQSLTYYNLECKKGKYTQIQPPNICKIISKDLLSLIKSKPLAAIWASPDFSVLQQRVRTGHPWLLCLLQYRTRFRGAMVIVLLCTPQCNSVTI